MNFFQFCGVNFTSGAREEVHDGEFAGDKRSDSVVCVLVQAWLWCGKPARRLQGHQSDGPQPHHVNIEFLKKTPVSKISVFVNYHVDESYTPSKILIKAGSHFHDLTLVTSRDLAEPSGWVTIKTTDSQNRPVKGFLFQISVTANHQNGRDTHIRQVRVYEPASPSNQRLDMFPIFHTEDCLTYQTVR